MNENELAELRTEADKVADRDYHLGAVLHRLINHIARAHGLNTEQSAEETSADEEEETTSAPVVPHKGKVK